ncbi:MAG: sugar phosphate isomerase/epimerase family protein [Actinomycetota bacterium]
MRDAVDVDLPGALARVAASGYVGVETLGRYGLSAADLARMLEDAELAWVGAFVGYQGADAFAAELDALGDAGCTCVVVPFLSPELFVDHVSIGRAAEMLSAATVAGAERNISVGYHNHYWEMAPVDGRLALLRLFDDADPRAFAEVDIYWAQVGGVAPSELLNALGDRVRLLHVKDGPASDPGQPMTAVGSGAVDIPAALGAAPHAEWHVVELDHCDSDVFAAVEASARFLLDGGWCRGG